MSSVEKNFDSKVESKNERPAPVALTARRYAFMGVAAAALIKAGPAALAQGTVYDDVSPNVTVSERFDSNFEPDGLRTGGFTLFPSLSVESVYESNIFTTPVDETDDFATNVAGRVGLRSNWSVHGLEFFARIQRLQYHEQRRESVTDYTAGGSGYLDITSTARVRATGSYSEATEARRATQTPAGAVEPVQFSTTAAALDFDIGQTRFREQFGVSYRKDNFDDVFSFAGPVIDQDFRDREVYAGYFRQLFRVSPTLSAFAEIAGEIQEYNSPQPGTAIFQDSESYRISGGVAFDINRVARGEIGAGYESRDYDDPVFTDISGVNVDATLEYFLSDLTTLTLRGDRTIRDTAIPGVAGATSTGVSFTAEHELLRPLVLVGVASYRNDDFRGLDRTDKVWTFTGGVDYAFRREVIFSLRYLYFDVDSDGAFARAPFTDHIARLGVEFRL